MMSKFAELIEKDVPGERRVTKGSTGVTIGVERVDGAPYLAVFEDGAAVRMLTAREMRALLVDVSDDWRLSNQ